MKKTEEKKEEKHYRINFFNGGIGLQNMSEGTIVHPNLEYWTEKFGSKEVEELEWPWVLESVERVKFYKNHWVRASLFSDVYSCCCDRLGIDVRYVDDIVVPLSDFEMANVSLIGDDIRDVAREVRKLQELFVTLENRYKHVSSLTFRVGDIVDIDVKNGGYILDNLTNISFKTPRALDPIINRLKSLAKSDVQLNRHVFHSGYLDYEEFSLRKTLKSKQHEMATILFQYLQHEGISKSKRDGYIKAGTLLSLLRNDYIIDEEFFQRNASSSNYVEYESYEYYLADVMGKRIERFLQDWTKKIKI